jgi:hypothetical protein
MLFFWIMFVASAILRMPVHIALLVLLIQFFESTSLTEMILQLAIQHVLLRLIR